jgi:hypothetical protein
VLLRDQPLAVDHKLSNLTGWLCVGALSSVSVAAEFRHEDQPEQPHAEYLAIAPGAGVGNNNANIAMDNVSPSTVTVTHHPAPLNLEELLPHDHLTIQVNGLLTPPKK